MLIVHAFLSRASTGIGAAFSHSALEGIFTTTARVLSGTNVGVETGVVLGVAAESALMQVFAVRLGAAQLTGHIGHI